ncbi:MAG: CHAT domain-containing protein [Saprospiraceae bacterium]
MKLNLLLLFSFCCWSFGAFGQKDLAPTVDRIIKEIKTLEPTESVKIIDEALRQHQNQWSKQPSLRARLLQKKGIEYYLMDAAHYKEALADYQAALSIWGSANPPFLEDITYTYYLITMLQKEAGQYIRAIENGKIALEKMAATKNVDQTLQAKICFEIGETYVRTEDFSNALQYLEQASQLFLERNETGSLLECYNSLAGALDGLGKAEEALSYYQKIITSQDADEEQLANAYANRGVLFLSQNDYTAGLPLFQKAKNIFPLLYAETEDPFYRKSLATCLENISICYKGMGNYEEAKLTILESMSMLQAELPNKFHPDVAKCHDNLGDLHFAQANYQLALTAYHEGIACLLPTFVEKDLTINPDLSGIECEDNRTLLRLLSGKARSFKALYELDTTQIVHLRNAHASDLRFDELLTEIRQGFRSSESVYALLEDMHKVYETAIHTAIHLHQLTNEKRYFETAYQFAAKNKASVLLDALQAEQAKFAGLPSDLLQKEKALKKDYLDLEAQLFKAKANPHQEDVEIQKLQTERFALKVTYEKLIDNFEKNFPQYYKLKYAYDQRIDIASFQKKLPTDGALLEYFIGEEQIFLFGITKEQYHFFAWEKLPDFEKDCNQFRSMISDLETENDPKLAYRLFQQLLAEPLAKIEQKQTLRRLFIIPDGALLRISFDPLLTEPVATWKNKTNPYVIKKYAISYAYTNQLLFAEDKTVAKNDLELFGGFALDYRDSLAPEALGFNGGKSYKRNLGVLENAPEEVKTIAELLDGSEFTNEEVSKQHFLENAGRFKILHWAGHGWIREDDPMNSALVFSLTKSVEDSLLRVIELYALELNAEMVVLSACNTAYGKVYAGEGISSLARAFAYAGCPTVVSSLWNAADISTKEILVDFYKSIKTEDSKDVALQKAKLTYLTDNGPRNADPALWANMIVIGDSEPLDINTSSYLLWGILAVVLFCGLYFGYRYQSA